MRISSLSKEQRTDIAWSFNSNLIIKILKEGVVLNDCVQYDHYVAWYENIYSAKTTHESQAKFELPTDKWAIAS